MREKESSGELSSGFTPNSAVLTYTDTKPALDLPTHACILCLRSTPCRNRNEIEDILPYKDQFVLFVHKFHDLKMLRYIFQT